MEPSPQAKRVAVLGGGGLMGHGIALTCLRAGCEVAVISRTRTSAERSVELIARGPFGLERAVARGKIAPEDVDGMLSRVRITDDYEDGLLGVELVFESVPEIVELKLETLTRTERFAPREAIIAMNTSAIMIAELSAALSEPERLVGTHWFYPANVMPLVEVAKGETTSAVTLDAIVRFLRSIGKHPVVVADSPGFFMTRFINLFIAEAIRSVELGVATPAAIDDMLKTGLGWPVGVFELLDDTASFDSWYHAQEYLWRTCGERYAIPPLARKVFAAGYRGDPSLKPGSRGGWYDYLKAERPRGGQETASS